MKHFLSPLALILLLATGCGSSKDTTGKGTAPVELARSSQDPEEARPRFYAEYANIVSTDTSGRKARIIIFLVAPLVDLSFTTYKVGGAVRYRAEVTWEAKLSFNAPRKDIEVSDADFIRREIVLDTHEETRTGVTTAEKSFYVTPEASYSLEIIFTDEETGATNKRIYPHVGSRLIKDGVFALADPIIFVFAKIDSSMAVLPMNSRRVDPWQKIPFITVIYYPPKGQRIQVYYEIEGPNNENVFKKNQTVPATQNNWTFDTLFVNLPDEAGNGEYALSAAAMSEDSTRTFTVKRSFKVYSTIPRSAKELDEAARQMVYIRGTEAVIDSILKAQTVTEKKRLWLGFWKSTDPDPARAETLMKEYYRRVAFANERFRSQNQPGWKTDRGRVYIRFGKPRDVDRHPFEAWGKPYEIWHYPHLRNRDSHYFRWYPYKFFIFVERFVDNYDFGDGDIYMHNLTEVENY